MLQNNFSFNSPEKMIINKNALISDDKFVNLINNLSELIKEYYFANKNNINELFNLFSENEEKKIKDLMSHLVKRIEKQKNNLNNFIERAKDIFKKMKIYKNNKNSLINNISANSKNIGESAYQLEVFVIELLISIYGEKILNPYFQNNPLKFYYQFKSGEYSIIYLDILLNQISKWVNVRNSFEEYIILRDFVPDELKKYNLYIETFDMKELSRYLKRYEFMINKLYDKIEKEKRLREVFFDRYALQKEESKKMYLNWYYEYSKIQKRMFDKIIKIIIVLARKQDMSDELIKDLLIRNLDNKKSILDVIEYKNKKLVRK